MTTPVRFENAASPSRLFLHVLTNYNYVRRRRKEKQKKRKNVIKKKERKEEKYNNKTNLVTLDQSGAARLA